MNIDPTLGKVDRIGSIFIGIGVVAYAGFGTIGHTWGRVLLGALGIIFLVGGVWGT